MPPAPRLISHKNRGISGIYVCAHDAGQRGDFPPARRSGHRQVQEPLGVTRRGGTCLEQSLWPASPKRSISSIAEKAKSGRSMIQPRTRSSSESAMPRTARQPPAGQDLLMANCGNNAVASIGGRFQLRRKGTASFSSPNVQCSNFNILTLSGRMLQSGDQVAVAAIVRRIVGLLMFVEPGRAFVLMAA